MVKNLPVNVGGTKDVGLIPVSGRSLGGGNDKPMPIFLPGTFRGQKSLVGYSLWGAKSQAHLSD